VLNRRVPFLLRLEFTGRVERQREIRRAKSDSATWLW
jgi:hypothetical protein